MTHARRGVRPRPSSSSLGTASGTGLGSGPGSSGAGRSRSGPYGQGAEAWNLLHRFACHAPLVALLSLLGALLGLGYGLRYKPTFHSEAQVRVGDELDARAVPGQREDPADLVDLPESLATAFRARVLVEPKLARMVLGLSAQPSLAHVAALRSESGRADLVEHIQRHALIEAVTRRVFRVSYDGPDPDLAQQVAQGLAELGVRDVVAQRALVATAAREFLSSESERARHRLLEAETEIVQFVRAHPKLLVAATAADRSKLGLQVADKLLVSRASGGLLPLQALRASDTPELQALLRQRAELEAQATQLEQTQKLDPVQPKLAEIERLAQQQSELRAQHYTDDYPDLRRIGTEIARIKGEIADLAQRRDPKLAEGLQAINDARTRIAAIDRQVLLLRKRVTGEGKALTPDEQALSAEAEYARKNRDLETQRLAYEKLRERELEAVVTEQLSRVAANPAARIEDPAGRPTTPRGIGKKAMAGLALALGFAAGFLAGLVRVLADSRVYTTLDLAQVARLPVLGRIPRAGRGGRGGGHLPEFIADMAAEGPAGFEASALGLEAVADPLSTLAPSQRTPPGLGLEVAEPSAGPPPSAQTPAAGAEPLSESLAALGFRVEAAPAAKAAPGTAAADQDGPRAAQHRLIRCRLEDRGDPRVIVITSSRSGEGAAAFTAALARACAEGGGERVVVVDADLTAPGQRAQFGLPAAAPVSPDAPGGKPAKGADKASERAGRAPVAFTARPNLAVVPAESLGEPGASPAEVLSAPPFLALVGALRRCADYVLIAAPALETGAEARLALRPADAGLLVVRARHTPASEVGAALDRLGRDAVAGTVLVQE